MSATTDALSAAVDAENAAVFTYGVMTAFVSAARRTTVAEYIAAHRTARDVVSAALTATGATAPVAAAGYTLPVAVTGSVSAVRAGIAAEDDCARAYRVVLEQADTQSARRIAVDGLTACAERAARWRAVLRQSPITVAFPGGRA
ncbi:MAG: ferritin-like domain-containing protein [Gordonia sp. (in: high G+C Gram-positive bacteria)]